MTGPEKNGSVTLIEWHGNRLLQRLLTKKRILEFPYLQGSSRIFIGAPAEHRTKVGKNMHRQAKSLVFQGELACLGMQDHASKCTTRDS